MMKKHWLLRVLWVACLHAVSDATTEIFLESAFFAPTAHCGVVHVAFGLHTDASQRYERGVDLELPMIAMHRASQSIAELAGGEFGPITVAENAALLPTREAIELNQASRSTTRL